MYETHQNHFKKLEGSLLVLQKIADIRAKSELWKFYNAARKIWTEMDKEMVTCRRKGRLTLRYTELEAHYAEAIHTFEQWTTMAALMYA